MVEMEETEMERKRRDAEPVVVPTHTNLLPTTYHHLAGAYPVYYNNPYLTYPIHQVRSSHTLRSRVCHLQFFLISLYFQAGIYPRHTKEQE